MTLYDSSYLITNIGDLSLLVVALTCTPFLYCDLICVGPLSILLNLATWALEAKMI